MMVRLSDKCVKDLSVVTQKNESDKCQKSIMGASGECHVTVKFQSELDIALALVDVKLVLILLCEASLTVLLLSEMSPNTTFQYKR